VVAVLVVEVLGVAPEAGALEVAVERMFKDCLEQQI
jgi:hypothetical protein